MITTVLFDLDGTISDSAPGILASLRQAFDRQGIARLSPEQKRELLGPPFYASLPPLVGAHRLEAVIEDYREYYGAGGMFDTTRYDGVGELIDELRGRGVTLAIATSKPEPYALPIVEHLGLAEAFTTICGDTLDGGRDTKALVVREALRRLGNPSPGNVLMVGDRIHDVEGAAANGIRTIGAGWGYGTAAELVEALTIFPAPHALGAALDDLLGGDSVAAAF